MADDNAYGNGNGRTPSPRREDAPAERSADDRPYRSEGQGDQNPGNNLHVRGLAMQTAEQDLEEVFGKFGQIEKCQVMRDPRTKDSRGFAFVTFVEAEAAEEAMSALNATNLDGKTIVVEKAKRGRARTPTPGMYRGPDKSRYDSFGGRGGYGGGPRGYDSRRDPYPPPRRFDDRYDDRRGGGGGGWGGSTRAQPMRDEPYGRDRPPRRDFDDRPPRRDYDDRRREDYDRPPPRRDDDRRERRDYGRHDDGPARY